jgi:methionyl-tRNA synthetase
LKQKDLIFDAFNQREFGRATRLIMEGADFVNQSFDAAKPWALAKIEGDATRATLQAICSDCLRAFFVLTECLSPVLPDTAEKVRKLFESGVPNDRMSGWHGVWKINPYQHLMQRVDIKQLDALFEAPEPAATAVRPEPVEGHQSIEPLAPEITIDDFSKVDLRIAKIINCEAVEGSTKLLRLTLDAGEGTDPQGNPVTRNVFSGIASYYKPADLIGKHTVMVANLAPRKMKFGVSEGMVLAASSADEKAHPGIYVLEPVAGAQPGMRIR